MFYSIILGFLLDNVHFRRHVKCSIGFEQIV